MKHHKKILVIRNDKIGDFMLAWPALSLLKNHYPNVEITALIPSYTLPLAEACIWIDNVIVDDQHQGTLSDARHLANKIKRYKFDAAISLYTEMRTALALRLANIPYRIGPATKLAQIFINKKLKQKRSRSLKPEYEYNVDLVRHFITLNKESISYEPAPPYLVFNESEIADIRQKYISNNKITQQTKLVLIHPGTGGSAINLSIKQYAELATNISHNNCTHFILTAGPGEEDIVQQLSSLLININHSIYYSKNGLIEFSKFINICDLFISGSTGPLHIAGALNISTVAFYPARKSATSLRWKTLNEETKQLAFMPKRFTGINDMETINIINCAIKINNLLDQKT